MQDQVIPAEGEPASASSSLLTCFPVQERSTVSSQFLRRAFMRVVIRRISTPDLLSALYQQHATRAASAAIAEAEAVLPRCLHELHRLSAQSVSGPADWVHIFVSLLPPLPLGGEAGSAMHIAAALRAAAAQAAGHHAAALRKAAVAEWTIRIRSEVAPDAQASVRGWRVIVSLPSGLLLLPISNLHRVFPHFAIDHHNFVLCQPACRSFFAILKMTNFLVPLY